MELRKGTKLQKGKYRIEKVLGRGTFGITYLASAKLCMLGTLGKMDVDAKVAIKEFFMSDVNSRKDDGCSVSGTGTVFTSYSRKFRKEAENLAGLSHPDIVKVSDIFDENDTTYYIMEYIEGENLDDYIKSRGRIPEDEAVRIFKEIGNALSYMHSKKMLHLDMKPKNVMHRPDGSCCLIDFGLSKQFNDDGEPESSTSIGLGTPGYAPLEQAHYKQDGTFPATLDVYALGATMLKMLTGERPPEASHILNDGFPEDIFANISVSKNITDAVRKALNPIKGKRFQTIKDMTDALAATLDVHYGNSYCKEENVNEEGTEITADTDAEYDDTLPMPDFGVKIELHNPEPGSLSYEFYLNEGICNTAYIYRSGGMFYDMDWAGGIRDNIKDKLRQYGFLSKKHWEEEETTTYLTGIKVAVSFFYKNGTSFIRRKNNADSGYHHRMLDAVQNLIKDEELSVWIDEALNHEHRITEDDLRRYGISIFSFGNDNNLQIYHRGMTYQDNYSFLMRHCDNYQDISNAQDYIKYDLIPKELYKKSFVEYIRDNRKLLADSYNIITYISEDDFLNIAKQKRKNPYIFGTNRVINEMQLIPLCYECDTDKVCNYEYNGLFCDAESGGDVCEILQTGYIKNRTEANCLLQDIETCQKYHLNYIDSFTNLVTGAIVQYKIIQKTWQENNVLLATIPFDIEANFEHNNQFAPIIAAHTSIPCLKSVTVDAGISVLKIRMCGETYALNIKDLFRYHPKQIELKIGIDSSIDNINFTLTDKEMRTETSMSLFELLRYVTEHT